MTADDTDTHVQPRSTIPPPPTYEPEPPPPPPPDCQLLDVPCNPKDIKWRHDTWEFRGARHSHRADGTTIDVEEWHQHWVRSCMHCGRTYCTAIEYGEWRYTDQNTWERHDPYAHLGVVLAEIQAEVQAEVQAEAQAEAQAEVQAE